MSPTSLRVEVEPVAARLVTVDGRSEAVTFFEHAGSRPAQRHGSIIYRLNDPETMFVPCRVLGRERLIRLDWIAYIEFDKPPAEALELAEVGARSTPVRLLLVTGDIVEGKLFYEGGTGGYRVSDYLNRLNQRFILVSTPDAALYVRRRSIACVDL
ncbi:MAG: hypothetical protein R3190_13170 [Thermoanaerobaculia bacterium]|nr:hypothetical protein [Thermoanaerobaculia bacterium]